MVTLFNIKKSGKTISCNYYPEDSDKKGYVVLDIESQDVIEKELSQDDNSMSHLAHAARKLREIRNDDDFPKEIKVVWY